VPTKAASTPLLKSRGKKEKEKNTQKKGIQPTPFLFITLAMERNPMGDKKIFFF